MVTRKCNINSMRYILHTNLKKMVKQFPLIIAVVTKI